MKSGYELSTNELHAEREALANALRRLVTAKEEIGESATLDHAWLDAKELLKRLKLD